MPISELVSNISAFRDQGADSCLVRRNRGRFLLALPSGYPPSIMTKAAAGLALLWLLIGLGIELASYLPFDPEWTLLATFFFFGTSFLVGAVGAYFMAPALVRFRAWPKQLRLVFRWTGIAWILYTAVWFAILWSLPGSPTHCGTLGSPDCGHEYVFDNHGTLTVTDRAGFLAGVRILVRLFASPPIAVMSVILVAHQVMNRRGRAPLDIGD